MKSAPFNPNDKGLLISIVTDNDPEGNLNWTNSTNEPDHWEGVMWKNLNGELRVRWIEGHNKGLTGDLTFLPLTFLHTLNLSRNQLKKIDLSGNLALKWLDLSHNQLTEMDLSRNEALQRLDLSHNQLTEMDLSENLALRRLDLSANQLTKIDLSENLALKRLNLSRNQLTTIDLSRNEALEWLDLSANQFREMDLSANLTLKILFLSENQLREMDISRNLDLSWLKINHNQLESLEISHNFRLKELEVQFNRLSFLDISHNNSLNRLNVNGNRFPLSRLDSLMKIDRLCVGTQTDVELPVLPKDKLVVGQPYDIGSEKSFNGLPTNFTVFFNDSPATQNSDYKLNNGVIVFLSEGEYRITMKNKQIHNKPHKYYGSDQALVTTSTLIVRLA
ncbi:MAG: hypothetical protein LBE80_01190 [Deltaproteobacteria bacterium]|jgi:hypothetical protein|nr:hypothetical protein [Deltaproteobacteria bacterium]